MNPEPSDPKAGPEPYPTRGEIPTGVGPGSERSQEAHRQLVESLQYERPLERNVSVGPLAVSSCLCPSCGEVFAHYELFVGGYHACLAPDEQPQCPRCVYATAWPKAAAEVVAAMVECRWRYHAHLVVSEPGSGKSTGDMREAFLKTHDAFWRHGPTLLAALEFVFGDQVQAGVAAIEGGASGVEEQGGEGGPEAESRSAGPGADEPGAHPGAAAGSAPARPAEPGPAEGAGAGSPARAG